MQIEVSLSGALVSFQVDDLGQPDARGLDPFGTLADTHFLVRSREGIFCYRDSCPHIPQASLAWRKDRYLTENGMIHCGAHGALFEPDSGECVSGPCLGDWLKSYPVTIQGDEASVFIPKRD